MRAARLLGVGVGFIVIALAASGCKYTWISKDELREYQQLRMLNERQAGTISQLQANMTGVTKERDLAVARVDEMAATIEAQRKIMENMGAGAEALDELIRKMNANWTGLGAEPTPEGPRITLQGDVTFEPGKESLTAKGKAELDKIAAKLKEVNNKVRISGYTDPDPIKHSGYKSNMHLSAMRALSVYEYLVAKGVSSKQLSVAGFGENSLKMNADGSVNKGASRRAEILIVAAAYSETPAVPTAPVAPKRPTTPATPPMGGPVTK